MITDKEKERTRINTFRNKSDNTYHYIIEDVRQVKHSDCTYVGMSVIEGFISNVNSKDKFYNEFYLYSTNCKSVNYKQKH